MTKTKKINNMEFKLQAQTYIKAPKTSGTRRKNSGKSICYIPNKIFYFIN